MSSESAFNKRLEQETAMDKVEGLLEHLNLPPRLITFIRAHQLKLQIVIGVIVVIVVTWSLYGSYRDQVVEDGATALSLAMKSDGDSKSLALQKVVEEYGSTSSALWAKIELAHLDMKNDVYKEATAKYDSILEEVDINNPLYSLVLYGKGQSLEAQKSYPEATVVYDKLKEQKGYEHIAYLGKGRLEEAQGNFQKAIAVYNNFLLTVGDDPSFSQARTEIESKIARVKATQ